ncbi:MAG: type II toxin-antitoxin system VapC family toxin [Pseudomonadota bacterium]
MAFLIDTHVLIWDTVGDPRLDPSHRKVLNSDAALFVSAVTLWEVEIKRMGGKLRLSPDFCEGVLEDPFEIVDISADHAIAAGRLPLIHRDPFDRMLVAQAQSEGLTILTADEAIKAYDVATL